MAEAPLEVDIDPDFAPLSRPRSCTWPLPRPELGAGEPSSGQCAGSPLGATGGPQSVPAETYEGSPGDFSRDFLANLSLLEESEAAEGAGCCGACGDFQCPEPGCCPPAAAVHSAPPPQQQQVPPRKSSSSRRNAWGNLSYADLITKAIESSAEKRLTLSQIYDWMVKSVPYFKDKGDSNSSAGWKNSIRHNLSLHSKFIRVQNEGTGKSSWWMLNPEGGKSGKSPRRRAASMDNNSKFAKSRGRAAKKKAALQPNQDGSADSPGSQFSKWPGSPGSQSNDDFDAWSTFRPRTSSNASTLSGRLSPIMPEHDDLEEGDVHSMGYPTSSTKMSSTLPSLSEMRNSENMENLLDNLNLLSPNASLTVSTQSSSASLMQQTVGYSYTSPNTSMGSTNPDYRKFPYGPVAMNSLPLTTIQDSKSNYASVGQFNCPAGLLKELLTSDSPPHSDILPQVDTVASQANRACGQNLLMGSDSSLSTYGSQPSHNKINMSTHSHQAHAQQSTVNACILSHALNSMTNSSGLNRLSAVKTSAQVPMPPSVQMTSVNPYSPLHSCNGFGRMGIVSVHQEKLPSDLDDMLIERLDCDMESIIRNDLMDGQTDFNFDTVLPHQSFSHSVKTTTHSWVSG